MELEFFGAAGEVTGSCHVLTTQGRRVLLDCGMIQGSAKDEARNREPFPFDPAEVDAVILSHAHVDHSGRLPLLVKRGYGGTVHTHNATCELCEILLLDAASLNERDTEIENRKRERKGLEPIAPLYTRADARAAIKSLRGHRYRDPVEVVPGVELRFHDAGHIMGSAIVELRVSENGLTRTLVFSGDLGPHDAPILHDPAALTRADMVVMESTYGGRRHRDREHTIAEIADIISDAEHHRGNILIPAFAIGRSQEILYTLGKHYEKWQLDRWHVFLDSPMAIAASEVYWSYPHLYDDEATKLRRNIDEMPPLRNLHLTETVEESRVINRLRNGAIIIAGSGMCNGGRIVHHLKRNLWRKECHVVIVGYQARGSLGRRLVEGHRFVRIHRESIRVAAQIHTVGGLSAHGDQGDLERWYGHFQNRPSLYLVHGEPESAAALSAHLGGTLRAPVDIARPGQRVDLTRL